MTPMNKSQNVLSPLLMAFAKGLIQFSMNPLSFFIMQCISHAVGNTQSEVPNIGNMEATHILWRCYLPSGITFNKAHFMN